ncbi:hypothetical protein [Halorhabdus rudnickae]|uniref:hypothetical protein n=1 Tax=Halorhabdus rudnickae TaxID=1775544 RepID=UPI0010840A18|nr:hypothetical protein [Halorhabdus rudnickae]
MARLLPYHLEEGNGVVLSLQFANPDLEVVEQRLRNEREGSSPGINDFYAEIKSCSFDQEIHALYTAKVHPRSFDGYEEISEAGNEVLIDTVIEGFHQIEKECRDNGNPLRWYKQPELAEIVEAINQTNWRQRIPNVAGCLLSNLITTHGLPNANHRTALSFVQVYLRTYAPEFEIPETGMPGEWYEWAEEFVRESKRLLTLSRKILVFRYLDQWGCDGVIRKNDSKLRFKNYDLAVEEPLTYFRRQHKELSMEFIYETLERTEQNSLIGKEDLGRSVFIERLKSNQ